MKAQVSITYHGLPLEVEGDFYAGNTEMMTPLTVNPNDLPEFDISKVTFLKVWDMEKFLENFYVGDGAEYRSALSELEELCANKCAENI